MSNHFIGICSRCFEDKDLSKYGEWDLCDDCINVLEPDCIDAFEAKQDDGS